MIEIYPFKIDRKDRDAVPNGALLYITKSPNFCDKDLKRGILGTSGRKCSIDSNGQDGCDEMCCNRGYYIETQTVSAFFNLLYMLANFKRNEQHATVNSNGVVRSNAKHAWRSSSKHTVNEENKKIIT